MSADLEQLLRDTLQARATTITSGPRWTAPTGPAAPHRRRPPRWAGVLAAAAAVAAVAVGVVTLPHRGSHPSDPGTHTGSPSTTPSPTPTTTATPAPIGATCATTLPAAWVSAMRDSGVDVGANDVQPLSVGSDGTAVLLRDKGPTPGSSREVVLVPPGGAPTVAYTVPDPDHDTVESAELYGHWLVVATGSDPRPKASVVPGSSPMPNVDDILAIDRSSGDVVTVATGDSRPHYIDGVTVLDGRVYWDQRSHYGAPTATIRSYGLATRDHRTEFSGETGYLLINDVGIFDGAKALVRRQVPAVVSAAVGGDVVRLVTDGTAWAWGAGQTKIGWWQPGLAAPQYRSVPTNLLDFDDNHTGGLAVSGRYVFTAPIVLAVLDMTTGARAPIAGSGINGGHDQGQFDIAEGGGVVLGEAAFGTGHFVDGYWTDRSIEALRLDLSHLPELHC